MTIDNSECKTFCFCTNITVTIKTNNTFKNDQNKLLIITHSLRAIGKYNANYKVLSS